MFKFKVREGCGSHVAADPDNPEVSKTFLPGEVFDCESDLRVEGLPPAAQKFELVEAPPPEKKLTRAERAEKAAAADKEEVKATKKAK
jgi:hypothetical protein